MWNVVYANSTSPSANLFPEPNNYDTRRRKEHIQYTYMYLYRLTSLVLDALSLENNTLTMLINSTKFTWKLKYIRNVSADYMFIQEKVYSKYSNTNKNRNYKKQQFYFKYHSRSTHIFFILIPKQSGTSQLSRLVLLAMILCTIADTLQLHEVFDCPRAIHNTVNPITGGCLPTPYLYNDTQEHLL